MNCCLQSYAALQGVFHAFCILISMMLNFSYLALLSFQFSRSRPQAVARIFKKLFLGLIYVINQLKVKLYTSTSDHVLKTEKYIIFDLNQPLPLCGDIKIEVFHKPVMRKVNS